MSSNENDLSSRISLLEDEKNQGQSFDMLTWMQVIAACLVIPAIILGWGW
ncbi:hypothetical protein [Ancylobacter moscoviensis]